MQEESGSTLLSYQILLLPPENGGARLALARGCGYSHTPVQTDLILSLYHGYLYPELLRALERLLVASINMPHYARTWIIHQHP